MSALRRLWIATLTLVAIALAGAPIASAGVSALGHLVQVSGASPIPAACIGDNDAAATSVNVYNSEVEPWLAVDPSDPLHMAGAWQQDRWNDGGGRGLVTAASFDGGQHWTLEDLTKSSTCTGGTSANGGDYERASDPWVSIAPDGTTYLMSLSVDTNPGGLGLSPNAMLVLRSPDGGVSWDDPITLKRDENPNILNDKNTMTADPFDSSLVYAVWDRIVSPPGGPPAPPAGEHAIGYRGPTWFSRDDEWRGGLGAGADDLRSGHGQPDDRQPDRGHRQR